MIMTLLPGVTSSLTTIETKLRNSNYNLWRRVLVVLSSSSIFIALNGCLKTFFSYNLYGAQVSYPLIIATFLVIYSVYGLNKITDTEEDQLNAPERSNLISSHQKLFTYSSVAAYILAVVIGILHGWQVILVLLFPLLAGVIYSIQVHPRIPRLKDIFAVKSLIVALSWTVGNTFLPLVNYNSDLLVMSLIFYFFFIKSFINTVLFDLMDVEGDKITGAMTIPVVMGASRTIKLLLILNTTLIFLVYQAVTYQLFSVLIIPLIFCVIYGYVYILYFSGTKNRFQMDILVDGEWIMVAFISLLCMGI